MSESASPLREPLPGEKISRTDFEQVICLTPLVSIDILVRTADGRALLGRRKNEPGKGTFFVVGGRITKNETLAHAFRRLTLQELGVETDISVARFIGVFDHIYDKNFFEAAGFGTHYVALGYDLPLAERPPRLPDQQHETYVWMTEAELLASPEVHQNTKNYFLAIKDGLGQDLQDVQDAETSSPG